MSTITAPYLSWPTVAQAAVKLGVSYSHANKLTQSKALASVKLGTSRNATVLVDPATIDAYLARAGLVERRNRRTTIRRELLEVVAARVARRGPIRGTRYPLRPLVILLERAGRQELSTADIARIVGADRSAVLRARVDGLTEQMADRWSVHVGYHPSLVWGEDWWTAYETERRLASMRRHPSTAGAAA